MVGHDGAIIFIRHGGFFIKAHCSRVQLAHDLENGHLDNNNETTDKIMNDENQDLTPENFSNNKTYIEESDDDNKIIEQTTPIAPPNNSSKEQNTLENLTKQLAAIDINDYNNEKNNLHKIKKEQIIDFTVDNIPYKVEILSRAEKATGKFKNAFYVEYKEPISMCNEQGHVDFDKAN